MERTTNWEETVKSMQDDDIDVYVDWEERFFTCPSCGEPIYEEDYSIIENMECPVCEIYLL